MRLCSVNECRYRPTDLALDTCVRHSPVCSICLENVALGDDISVLRCGHKFHACCIYRWFDKDTVVCPYCRFAIREEAHTLSR
jgi:hypothetical protein